MTKEYNCEGNGEVHLDVLKAICGNTSNKSMIDLCCGFAPQTRQLGFKDRFYIDVFERDLKEENENFLARDIFWLMDSMFPLKMDCCFMLDAIEHFKRDDAYKILRWMNDTFALQIIFTPLGDYLIEKKETNNPDSHKSGWLSKEFEDMGWHTIVFPNFHPTLNIGAFFAFKCNNSESEFERIINELNKKEWTK